jgi:quercetin dioxygenase-like cupin family protein
MEVFKLDDMVKGWFIGDFNPSLYKTEAVEVGIKKYKKGDFEESHHHKIATEFTVILTGKVKMNANEYIDGDIIRIEPNCSTNFEALEDTITVVVKLPGAKNDKYID